MYNILKVGHWHHPITKHYTEDGYAVYKVVYITYDFAII